MRRVPAVIVMCVLALAVTTSWPQSASDELWNRLERDYYGCIGYGVHLGSGEYAELRKQCWELAMQATNPEAVEEYWKLYLASLALHHAVYVSDVDQKIVCRAAKLGGTKKLGDGTTVIANPHLQSCVDMTRALFYSYKAECRYYANKTHLAIKHGKLQ